MNQTILHYLSETVFHNSLYLRLQEAEKIINYFGTNLASIN